MPVKKGTRQMSDKQFFPILFIGSFLFSTTASYAEFKLDDKNKLNDQQLIDKFSGKTRTCEPNRRDFVMKFFENGKIVGKNNRGEDQGKWSVKGGKLCADWDFGWRSWCRNFYQSPTNPNQVGYRGSSSGTFYTCTLKPIK